MQYGYARVSTVQQDTALQRAAFKRAGVTRVTEEKRSGGATRPLLEALIGRLKSGDELVVYKIDRLARSLVDLLRVLERIGAVGASFRSLTEPIETGTVAGRMILQVLGAFAEFERGMIRERCMAGRAAAVERGVRFGRPVEVERERVLRLRCAGMTWVAIGRELGCDPGTAHRAASGVRVADGGLGEQRG